MPLESSRETLRKAWDQQAESWDEQAGRPEEYFTLRLRCVREFITRRISPCRSLDIGCANGLLSEWLALCRFDVYGVDMSEEMLERARKRLGALVPDAEHRFARAQDDSIPFGDMEFGLITALAMLEYVPDHSRFISRLAARVSPGGFIVASLVNPRSLYVALWIVVDLRRLGPGAEWRRVAGNCLRTGFWSGGYLDPRTARQVHGAAGIVRLFRNHGFRLVDELNFYCLSRRLLDRDILHRGRAGNMLARRLGWDHVGMYQKV